jgi:chromosome segregation ATPase
MLSNLMTKKTVLFVITAVLLAGCQTTYYAVWEKLGKEKRHLLRDQVEKSRDDQEQASEEFKDALTRLKAMYGLEGGDLEKTYERLSGDYDACRARADTVEERIDKVQRIAEDLFNEWRKEIDQIQNTGFRAKSAQKLKATQSRYARLEKALKNARKRMTPVLNNLNDYVLYLKHNLNARAIGSLKGEVAGIEADVDQLVTDIQRSIKEADAFLKEFEK